MKLDNKEINNMIDEQMMERKNTPKIKMCIDEKTGYNYVPTEEHVGEKIYYHIMTEDGFEKMFKFGKGLVGSRKKNRGYTTWVDDGMFYVVTCDMNMVWNSISYNELHKDKLDIFGRDGKPYMVVGILQSTLDKLGVEVEPNQSCKYELTNLFERQIRLGDKVIPKEELYFCGRYITDGDMWETNDRWLLSQGIMESQLGEEYDITKLRIQNPILGEVKYSERFEKTTNKMFPTKKKKLKFLKSMKCDLQIKEWENTIKKIDPNYVSTEEEMMGGV